MTKPTPASRSLLYDAVALGMTAYVRARFRVETIGLDRMQLDPGTIIAATHRSNDDIPVVAASLYREQRAWLRRELRPAFVVREDALAPGFFAGFPSTPPQLRRLLFAVSIGGILHRQLACYAVRPATRMRVVDVVRARPTLPVDALPVGAELERRAHDHRLPPPRVGGDVLRGEYADVLWRLVSRDDVDTDDLWAERVTASKDDLRRLVDLLRSGGVVFMCPEGTPSRDGSIGPLMRGIGVLARRGRARVEPLALAYDPLTAGRPHVVVAAGSPLEASRDVEDALLARFRRAMPLTAGQLVAVGLAREGRAPSAAEARASARADADAGRPVEGALLGADVAERIGEAAAAATRLGTSHPELTRLVRTYESARDA